MHQTSTWSAPRYPSQTPNHSITFWTEWNGVISGQHMSDVCSQLHPHVVGNHLRRVESGKACDEAEFQPRDVQSWPADCWSLKTCESAFRQKEIRKRKHWKPLSCWQDQWALRFLGHKCDQVRDHRYPWSQRLWQRGYRAHPGNGSVPAARMGPQLLDSSHPRMNHSFKGWGKFPYYPVFLLLQRELLRELLSEITRFK